MVIKDKPASTSEMIIIQNLMKLVQKEQAALSV